jgi:hypothetical protein
MDCVCSTAPDDVKNRILIQVTGGWRRRSDRPGFIGHGQIRKLAVGFRIDRHASDPQFPQSPDHPRSDRAAISHHYLLEHARILPVLFVIMSVWRSSL